MVSITDRRQQYSAGGSTVDYYSADIKTATYYSAFGAVSNTYNSNLIQYGFNGQRRSMEISGTAQTAEFWEYNGDVGKRWNVDPLANKFPWQSPYAAFDNNPINVTDPTGQSGEPVIDRKKKTITIYSNMIFYDNSFVPNKMNKMTAMKIAGDMEKQYNSANGKVKIDGTTYSVKFKMTGDYRNTLTHDVKSEIENNADIRNNYYRVGTKTDGLNSNPNTSYTDAYGANTGFFISDQIFEEKSTTASHEWGHTLGLRHEVNADGSSKVIHGQPGIMSTQVNDVDAPYQENVVQKGYHTPMLDKSKRKGTQADIDNLNLDKLKFDSNGKAKLGKLTNVYHKSGN